MRVPRFIKESRKKEQVGHRPLLPLLCLSSVKRGTSSCQLVDALVLSLCFHGRERDVERVSSSEEEKEKQKEEDDVAGCDFRFLLDNQKQPRLAITITPRAASLEGDGSFDIKAMPLSFSLPPLPRIGVLCIKASLMRFTLRYVLHASFVSTFDYFDHFMPIALVSRL